MYFPDRIYARFADVVVLRWVFVTRSRNLSTTMRLVNLDQRGATARVTSEGRGGCACRCPPRPRFYQLQVRRFFAQETFNQSVKDRRWGWILGCK